MKKLFLDSSSVLSIGLALVLLSTVQVYAQPLVPSTPTGTLTDGVNISINPEEQLPANGTVSISTEGAIDTDMNAIPPEGVSVVISNDTITVTNQTVNIESADEDDDETEEAEAAEDEGGSEDEDDSGGDEDDSGGDEDDSGGDDDGDNAGDGGDGGDGADGADGSDGGIGGGVEVDIPSLLN